MSWSVSGQAAKEGFSEAVDGLQPGYPLGEGGERQLSAAKSAVKSLVEAGAISGGKFNLSLGGHCQADSPGSGADSIYISVSAFTEPAATTASTEERAAAGGEPPEPTAAE